VLKHPWAFMLVLLAALGCGTVTSTTEGTGSGGASGTGGASGAHVCGVQAGCTRCNDGACCGDTCCDHGEWCDTTGATPVCRCGTGNACANGNVCTAPLNSNDKCGLICCQGNGCAGP
jgi:hypothetical protein